MKVKELLAKPEKWTKGFFARDAQGCPVEISSASAACWCLEGALHKCYPTFDSWCDASINLAKSINTNDTPKWNDAPERTHAEVLELVTKLDI